MKPFFLFVSLNLLVPMLLVASPTPIASVPLTSIAINADDEYEKYKKEGDELFKKGQYEKAQKKFLACLEVPGFSGDTYAKGRVSQCTNALRLRHQAQAALDKGQGGQAIDLFKQLLVINASDPITRQQLTDYWEREGNQRYQKGDYSEAKTRYQEALKYTNKPDSLVQQVRNCDEKLAAQKPVPAVIETPVVSTTTVATVAQPAAAMPIRKPTQAPANQVVTTSRKPSGRGLKIGVAAVGVLAGAYAYLLNSQYTSKLNALNSAGQVADPNGDSVIQTQALYNQWKATYDDTQAAQSKNGLFNACLGVAVSAAILETYLLIHRPKSNQRVSFQPASSTLGLALAYHF